MWTAWQTTHICSSMVISMWFQSCVHCFTFLVVAGMAVFGQAVGSLGSHVKTSWQNMVRMPINLTFESAATVPTVFITADTAFRHAVSLTAHGSVLIHAAAGECAQFAVLCQSHVAFTCVDEQVILLVHFKYVIHCCVFRCGWR